MSHLTQIAHRHDHDRWRDATFIGAAILLAALAFGATTSGAVGEPFEHQWSVRVIDPSTNLEVNR